MDISSAYTSFKLVSELNNLLQASKIDSEVKKKSAELTNVIISLQESISLINAKNQELVEINNNLRNKVIKMSKWNKEAKRYVLKELVPGVVVYALKEDQCISEPNHYLCTNCYQEERKSILQKTFPAFGNATYECKNPICKAVFETDEKGRKTVHVSPLNM